VNRQKERQEKGEKRPSTHHEDHGVVVDAPIVLDRQARSLGVVLGQDPQFHPRVLLQSLGLRPQACPLPFRQEAGDVEDRGELFGEELGLVYPFEAGVGRGREGEQRGEGEGRGEGDGREAGGERRGRGRGGSLGRRRWPVRGGSRRRRRSLGRCRCCCSLLRAPFRCRAAAAPVRDWCRRSHGGLVFELGRL